MKVEIEIPENISIEEAQQVYHFINEISKLNCKVKCTIDGTAGSMASFGYSPNLLNDCLWKNI